MTFLFKDSKYPVVPVRISISDTLANVLDRNLDRKPDPVTVNALVDSGASLTVIRPCVVEQLRLRQRGTCKIGGFATEATDYPNYDASVTILEDRESGGEFFKISDMQVVGAPLSVPDGIGMLIGMDILENFELTLNAREGFIRLVELEPIEESEVA